MTHYPDLAPALLASGAFDLVIHGHDHRVRVEGGPRRLLNPGTCSGYGVPRATVAVVDTADLSVEVVDIGCREGVLDRPAALFYKENRGLKVAVRTADNRD